MWTMIINQQIHNKSRRYNVWRWIWWWLKYEKVKSVNHGAVALSMVLQFNKLLQYGDEIVEDKHKLFQNLWK